MKITVSDTSATGDILNSIVIAIENEKTTLREIIKSRVYQEVEDYNQKRSGVFNGLVQPNESEKVLNGYKIKSKTIVDAERQSFIALDAFKKNGFFVMVNDRQIDDLEEELLVDEQTPVHFIKLTPLVGG